MELSLTWIYHTYIYTHLDRILGKYDGFSKEKKILELSGHTIESIHMSFFNLIHLNVF